MSKETTKIIYIPCEESSYDASDFYYFCKPDLKTWKKVQAAGKVSYGSSKTYREIPAVAFEFPKIDGDFLTFVEGVLDECLDSTPSFFIVKE